MAMRVSITVLMSLFVVGRLHTTWAAVFPKNFARLNRVIFKGLVDGDCTSLSSVASAVEAEEVRLFAASAVKNKKECSQFIADAYSPSDAPVDELAKLDSLNPGFSFDSTGPPLGSSLNDHSIHRSGHRMDGISQVDKNLIFEGLKQLYLKKVLPLELASKYALFASPPLGTSDFDAKPMVLVLGQYSVGKTSFIRSLIGKDFPGLRIGPEPTTDRFSAIIQSPETIKGSGRQIPGHALVMQTDKPFTGLASFGNNFLSKFDGIEVSSSILRNITLVDTPGVLAGEKQRLGRDYDFSEVVKWFADRADMIIIMFDAHKLDISDELKTVLDALKPHQEKVRVLLNKADTIDAQSLLRVYGALMWSLGKVVRTPEASRVYLGSFWDSPLKSAENRGLFQREKADLLTEMMSLPSNAVVRRINELVKRARKVKVHAYIIHYLRKQMPYILGKTEKQQLLLDSLEREFIACARRYNLPLGDFPDVAHYRKVLSEMNDISAFKKLDKKTVYEMEKVMTHDIPKLLQKAMLPGAAPAPSPAYKAYPQSYFPHQPPSQQQQQQPQQQHYQHQYQHQQHQQQNIHNNKNNNGNSNGGGSSGGSGGGNK